MWSVSTILTGLYSFMVETGPTLGSIETTTAQKRKFARQSLDFNVRDSNFCKLFPDLVDLHKERMAERRRLNGGKEPSIQNISVTSPKADEDQMQGILATAAGIVALISVLFAMRFF